MTRRAKDAYFTPEFATYGLLARVPVCGHVFECCSGAHHITNPLRSDPRVMPKVTTNDLDGQWSADWHLDMRLPSSWQTIRDSVGPIDWVVTNPPFEVALDILEAARLFVPNIAMLLRVSFMEPTACGTPEKHLADGRVLPATKPRGPFLQQHAPNGVIYCPRISFTGDGHTDSATVNWLIWSEQRIAKPVDVIYVPKAA